MSVMPFVGGAESGSSVEAKKNFMEAVKGSMNDEHVVHLLTRANALLLLSTEDKPQIAERLFTVVHDTISQKTQTTEEKELHTIFSELKDALYSASAKKTQQAAAKAGVSIVSVEAMLTKAKTVFLEFCDRLISSGHKALQEIGRGFQRAVNAAKNKIELLKAAIEAKKSFAKVSDELAKKMEQDLDDLVNALNSGQSPFGEEPETLVGEFFKGVEEQESPEWKETKPTTEAKKESKIQLGTSRQPKEEKKPEEPPSTP